MTKIFVSQIDFGDAIVQAVGRKYGMGPYKVIAASFKLEVDTMEVVIEEPREGVHWNPISTTGSLGRRIFTDESEVIFVEKEAVLVELVTIIDMDRFGRRPCSAVTSVHPDIPDTVAIRLRYMPKGSFIEKPNFDGSISTN